MKLYMAILLGLIGNGCQSKATEASQKTETYLVSADVKSTMTAAQLKTNYGQLGSFVKNGYTCIPSYLPYKKHGWKPGNCFRRIVHSRSERIFSAA